jgi:hypothetical protein
MSPAGDVTPYLFPGILVNVTLFKGMALPLGSQGKCAVPVCDDAAAKRRKPRSSTFSLFRFFRKRVKVLDNAEFFRYSYISD